MIAGCVTKFIIMKKFVRSLSKLKLFSLTNKLFGGLETFEISFVNGL